MKRALLFLAALALQAPAHAQQTVLQVASSPVLDVQRLAPQLVAFAGSDVNFANLVNGLALGVPVTLATSLAPGVTQVVSFTPAGTMSATQIAQVLETARQSLIARGIATPSAEQLGATLVGGTLSTALGTTPVAGLVNAANALGTTTLTQQSPAAAIQAGTSAAVGGTAARGNTSDSLFPRGISDTPATAGTIPGPAVGSAPGTSAAVTGAPAAKTSTTR